MGFKINTIQVDNGHEFVNNAEKTNRKTRFQIVTNSLGTKIIKDKTIFTIAKLKSGV